MLTKSSIVVLGLVYETPINAYEIIKKIEKMNMKWWFPVGDSTIYATLKNLEKKKYIEGECIKEGNMPEKIIYTLTENGRQVLFDALRSIICSFDYDTVWFSIAAVFISFFPKEEAQSMLAIRFELLEQYIKAIYEQVKEMENQQTDMLIISGVKRMGEIVKAEKLSCSLLAKNFHEQ